MFVFMCVSPARAGSPPSALHSWSPRTRVKTCPSSNISAVSKACEWSEVCVCSVPIASRSCVCPVYGVQAPDCQPSWRIQGAWSVLWDTLCGPPPAEQVPLRCSLSAERPLEWGGGLWPSSHGLGEAVPRTDQWLPTRAPHAPAHCQTHLRKQASVALEPIKSWSRDRPESVSELQSYSRGCLGKRDGGGGTGGRRGEGKGEGREERGREASG